MSTLRMARSSRFGRRFLVAVLCGIGLSLAGCGTEVGRVACGGEGDSQGTVMLGNASPVVFWTQLDAAWEGEGQLSYTVETRSGGEVVHSGNCNALDVHTKINSRITNLGGRHTRKYQGKMECDPFVPPAAGNYEFSYELSATPGMTIDGCDLVLKQ